MLLSQARALLPEWLPGGKQQGHEYVCGNLHGEAGESLKVNTRTGAWADFAGDEKGGDLISLFAAIHHVTQGDAAKTLAVQIGYGLQRTASQTQEKKSQPAKPKPEPVSNDLGPPPADVIHPDFILAKHGAPTCSWRYHSAEGTLIFFVARYDPPGQRKQFVPFSWDTKKRRWVNKSWPAPRPLYGLHLLAQKPDSPVMIVEGEKACEAARAIVGKAYVVVCWPNGGNSYAKADFSPVHGRRILLWPDADKPGVESMRQLAVQLAPKCPEVKLLDPEGQVDGWDAADALADGWDWKKLVEWARPRAQVFAWTSEEIQVPSWKPLPEQPGDEQISMSINRVEVLPPELVPPAYLSEAPPPDAETVAESSIYAAYEKMGVTVGPRGPLANLENAMKVLEGWPELKDFAWFDVFHGKYLTTWPGETGPREWTDIDDLRLAHFFQAELGFRSFSDETANKAMRLYAWAHRRNEPKDWMESLKWDGHARIADFFESGLGVESSEYSRAASRNFWMMLVARIFLPGCKVDNMVILEGAQGTLKSTALSVIGGSWHTEMSENMGSKDFYLGLQGKLLVEIAELDSFNKADLTRIKQVITNRSDRYREPYSRASSDHPRQCIFVGTTNEAIYLRDATGARRFWPIKVGRVKLDIIRDWREQCFAEAVSRFRASERWYEMPVAETLAEQEGRQEVDPWEGHIAAFLMLCEWTTPVHIATECLKIEVGKVDGRTESRIRKTLGRLGWHTTTRWAMGKSERGWAPKVLQASV